MTTRLEDLEINGTCYTSNWFRSNGSTGWYNQTYGGGIYMIDSTWIRTYGSKNFYCSNTLGANVLYSETYVQPSAGSGSNGIIWPSNPGGGGGDTASIKYYPYSGEDCAFEIKVENDVADYIRLTAPGGFVRVGLFNEVVLRGTSVTSVRVDSQDGSYLNDWPGGWGGGLATFDICCASIRYSGLSQRSDFRYKENITNIENSLKKIIKLKPVKFNWKKDVSFYNPDTQYGFIAQDVEKIFPELITEDNNGYKSINSNAFVPLLVTCIQQQQVEIENQQKTIENLETRLKAIEDLLK